MVEVSPPPRHGTDHDLKPLPSFPGFCLPARPLRCRQEEHRSRRATARVRPQSARAAICRRPVTTNSPSAALSSFPYGGFSSSSCTPCVGSTVAAAALPPSKKFPGATANHINQSLHALLSPLGASAVMERDGRGLSDILGQGFRRGRTCRHLGPGTSDARPDRRYRRR